MSKKLVVVESPAKARTISRFLGPSVDVLASMGHVRDLPLRELGVDTNNDFRPKYELTLNGKKVIKSLRTAAAQADAVYLATDPDREGEAIAWHLQELLQNAAQGDFHRITFHEITQNAIRNSFNQPGEIAEDLVNAQQARRVLDRLVGYQVSPMLWRHIGKGTSAGRVQSVALRLIVEREREIQAFKPEEYWNLDALFLTPEPKTRLKTRLSRLNEEKAVVSDGATAELLEHALQSPGVVHKVAKVASTPRNQYAPPPFITSTLQQAAGSHLKFGTTQTMRVAQELYEGIEIGKGAASGLITYMRTDSVSVAKVAQEEAAKFIRQTFGEDYLPAKPNVYRSRKSAQEAHEAIRPTDVNRTPDSLAPYLSGPQLRLYRLIWNRFVASQMAPAKQLDHVIEIESSGGGLATLQLPAIEDKKALQPGVVCTFRAAARETKFQGYLAVYSMKDLGDEDEMDNLGGVLPPLKPGSLCELIELLKEQCFTNPPSRYSEAALVKALEQNGVGRPSTFAATVNTILERKYVSKEKSSLVPTKLGFDVNDFLVQQMPDLFSVGFTAEMEDRLDKIEEGDLDWVSMLKEFYQQLLSWMGDSAIQPGTPPPGKELEPLLNRLFPEDFVFAEPVKKGRFVYDDKKFITSIRKQLAEKKVLTERQWKALLNTFAKYAAENPDFQAMITEAGFGEQVQNAIVASENKPEKKTQELPPEMLKLLEEMEKIEWEKPVKRGKRVYDDEKFFRSLQRQAQSDGSLTEAQIAVLSKLAAKYAGKIAGYAELAASLGWQQESDTAEPSEDGTPVAAAPPPPEEVKKIKMLLGMASQIKNWREPTSKGKRVYDDREFVSSLEKQFQQKGNLSERQVAALVKLLSKYSEQIPDFKEKGGSLGGITLQPQLLEEKCPNCGAPLVQRMGRGRPFIGCSAFPKCRYIAPKKKNEE